MTPKQMHVMAVLPFVAGAVIIVGNGLVGWLSVQTDVAWAVTATALLKILVEVARYVQANSPDGTTEGDHDPPTA